MLLVSTIGQLLFKPLEPFLVDDRGDHKHPGRVQSRHCGVGSSVTCFQTTRRLWAADVSDAMLAGDRAKTERLTRIFQDRVAAAIEGTLNVAAEDDKVCRRILQQIGTPRARR